MTMALRDAGVAPDEVDYIVAHGTSTPLNDVTETRAIKAAFGEHAYKVAISSPKSMVGHLLGAAGVMSALTAIGAIRENIVPPTANLDDARPRLRPGLHAARGAPEAGGHRDHQRLRVRRPERGRGLPPLRGARRATAASSRPERAQRRRQARVAGALDRRVPAEPADLLALARGRCGIGVTAVDEVAQVQVEVAARARVDIHVDQARRHRRRTGRRARSPRRTSRSAASQGVSPASTWPPGWSQMPICLWRSSTTPRAPVTIAEPVTCTGSACSSKGCGSRRGARGAW